MMVRIKVGTGTNISSFKTSSIQSWRALKIMAKVALIITPKSASFFKVLESLSLRQWSMLTVPNQRSVARILT